MLQKGKPVRTQVFFKYLASFFKRTWKVEDYPIRITEQNGKDVVLPENLTIVPWYIEIVHWEQMCGTGTTKQAALVNIQHKLETYQQQHGRLPRPGTHVPLEFALTNEINQYEIIARDYLRNVLNMDYDYCFISDQSSLLDFFSTEDFVEKTQRLYGIDISDITDGNLVQIFKRLHESQVAG